MWVYDSACPKNESTFWHFTFLLKSLTYLKKENTKKEFGKSVFNHTHAQKEGRYWWYSNWFKYIFTYLVTTLKLLFLFYRTFHCDWSWTVSFQMQPVFSKYDQLFERYSPTKCISKLIDFVPDTRIEIDKCKRNKTGKKSHFSSPLLRISLCSILSFRFERGTVWKLL